MQRHRFYASPERITTSQITLDADESHHLARVLRLAEGARAFVFDGAGAEYECEIRKAHKQATELVIVTQLQDEVESPLALTLGQALVKGDKFDWIVQKTTELGVTRIVPLLTDHSDIKHSEERAEHRQQRWRRISLEAVKQCGRRRLVEIAEPISFAQFCRDDVSELKFFFSERGGKKMQDINDAQLNSVSLTIGPEGGWSDAEIAAAETHHLTTIHLGRRILRTETAAVIATALLQHRWGDY